MFDTAHIDELPPLVVWEAPEAAEDTAASGGRFGDTLLLLSIPFMAVVTTLVVHFAIWVLKATEIQIYCPN